MDSLAGRRALGWALGALSTLAAPCGALSPGDTVIVHFSDGNEVPGVLESSTREELTLKVAGGSVGWPMSSVARVESRAVLPPLLRFGSAGRPAGSGGPSAGPGGSAGPPSDGGTASSVGPAGGYAGQPPQPPAGGGAQPSQPPGGESLGGSGPTSQEREGGPAQPSNKPDRETSPPPSLPGAPLAPRRDVRLPHRQDFEAEAAARREAYRHMPSTPLMDFQFRLQEALDRRAHGLPFSAEPF